MANELQFYANPSRSGDTITATIYQDGVVIQSNVACNEVGSEAVFIGDFPAPQARGRYVVRFYSGIVCVAQNSLFWDGHEEVDLELYVDEFHEFGGLDRNNPINHTPILISSPNISIAATGDRATNITKTRN